MKVVPSDDSVLGINEAFATLAVCPKDKSCIQMLPNLEEIEECFQICCAKHCFSPDSSYFYYAGEDNSMIFDCTECYDPVTKQWTTVASMNHPRCALGVCTCYGAIYALGKLLWFFK